MKPEIKEVTFTLVEKVVLPPAPKKVSNKRTIRTSLQNSYMKKLILNTDVEVKLQARTKTVLDCRDEKSNVLGCPLNKEPTDRAFYLLQKPIY
jgi:hypothetical protein